MIVHHLNNSRSQGILWMLEEPGFEYDIRFHKRNADTVFTMLPLRHSGAGSGLANIRPFLRRSIPQ